MSWAVGWDPEWYRDIGYGVPAWCDHPDCWLQIDRGLAYVCGGEPYGGNVGCGLYFCYDHLVAVEETMGSQICERCLHDLDPFDPKPDTADWLLHKLTDPSWETWRLDDSTGVRVALRTLNATPRHQLAWMAS